MAKSKPYDIEHPCGIEVRGRAGAYHQTHACERKANHAGTLHICRCRFTWDTEKKERKA